MTASTTTTTTAASTIPSTELDSTLLVANGTTVAGVFYSGPLYANSTYTVYAYTSVGLSANQTVKVGMSDVSINLEIPVPQPPNVAITNVVMSPSVVNPGTTFGALVTVQNEGNSTAYGVLLSLSVASPFTLQNAGSSEDLGNLAAGASKSFTLPVDVSYTAKAGSYTIGYTLNYSDAASNAYVSTGNIGVQVSGNPLTPNLIVSTVSFAPSALNPGSSFQATVDVSNIGYSASYNGLLSLTIPSPISLVGSSSSIALGTIAANGSRSYTFSAYVPTTAKAGSYSVSYTFTYNDKLGTSYTGTGSLSIVVVSPATVLLQDVAFLSPTLTPGTDTQLQMLVVNGGGDDALNVKVSWAGDASFLSNSTNFLGAIAPGAGTNSSFGLIIPSSTQPGSFNSTLAVSYTDSAGVFHESVIPFPIRVQPLEAPVLTITNTLLDPPVLSPGTQGTFTIYTSNIGTSTVYNVVVSITNGSKIFSSTTFGLGAVGAGAQVTTVVGVDVSPNIKPGSYVLGIETTYTDQAGVTHTSSVPLEITVYHSTSIFTATNLAIIVAVVIVAVAAGIVTNFTLKRRAQTQT